MYITTLLLCVFVKKVAVERVTRADLRENIRQREPYYSETS